MSPALIPYQEFYHWLVKATHQKEPGGRRQTSSLKQKTFPQFGSTLSYLLTADYSYTKLVESPSLDDMADALIRMNAGGISGLQSIGLLPVLDTSEKKLKHGHEDVKEAFKSFVDILDKLLTPKQKCIIGFDFIMVEHVLCRISQLRS
jgi:hypothetical protein